MKFNLLIKKISVCILSCAIAFAVFIPAAFAFICAEDSHTRTQALLCLAAAKGDLEEVKRLVADGSDINCIISGKTPLHWAAEHGHLEIVKFLIKMDVDINCKDREGRTALDLAIDNGHDDVAAVLNPNTLNNNLCLVM